MSNLTLAWDNKFDFATVTASSAAALLPATNLQQADITDNLWRGTAGTTESIFMDFGAATDLDTLALFGINLLATGTGQVRLSIADPTCVTNVYDSGTIAGKVDPNYKKLIFLLPSVITTARYARIDLVQAGASYIQAGRGFAGVGTQLRYNFVPGLQDIAIDPSIKKDTIGGTTIVSQRPQTREVNLDLQWITEAQRWSVVEAIRLANGAHKDILLIRDPSSANLGRDSFWGMAKQLAPVIMNNFHDDAGGFMHGTTINTRERL